MLTMTSTPDMVDSVNVLILAQSKAAIENISKELRISVGTPLKLCMMTLSFIVVGFHQGQCKASYCTKNSENQMLVGLGTVATSSLQSRSNPLGCQVGWGCRIHRLHLCRGVTPYSNECSDMTLNNLMMRFR